VTTCYPGSGAAALLYNRQPMIGRSPATEASLAYADTVNRASGAAHATG